MTARRREWAKRAGRRTCGAIVLAIVTLAIVGVVRARAAADEPVCAPVGTCGDMNGSGTRSAADALALLRAAVGLPEPLSCPCLKTAEVVFGVDRPIVSVASGGLLSSCRLQASFPLLADQAQHWTMVSAEPVGTLGADGLYTAADATGDDVVQVDSDAAPGLSRQQTVSVLDVSSLSYAFSNSNIGGVEGDGTSPSFPLEADVPLASITDYHWNWGYGTDKPGTIALRNVDTSKVYGPWQSTGQGYPANIYWAVNLCGLVLPAGTYEVLDSDPYTWAQNAGTGGHGMTWVQRWNPD